MLRPTRLHTLLFICLFLACMPIAACRTSIGNRDQTAGKGGAELTLPDHTLFHTAINRLSSGDAGSARTALEAAPAADVEDDPYGAVGRAALQVADHDLVMTPADLQQLLRALEGQDLPLAEALAYDALGTLYLQQDQPVEAVPRLQTALALAERANHPSWAATVAQKLGGAFARLGINGLAYDYTLRAHHDFTHQAETAGQVSTFMQLGTIYAQLPLLDEARNSYAAAIELARTTDDVPLLAGTLLGQGDVLAQQGQWADAETVYAEALALVQTEHPALEAQSQFKLGQLHMQLGEIETAQSHLSAAQTIFATLGDSTMLPLVEEAIALLPSAEFNVNLVQNPGAEAELVDGAVPGWVVEAGLTNWRRGREVEPFEGQFHFFVGATPEEIAELCQLIDVNDYALLIDQGEQEFELTLYTQIYPPVFFSSADASQFLLEYYGTTLDKLLDVFISPHYQSIGEWEKVVEVVTPPDGTRTIRLCLRSIKFGGFDSDGYFDEISFVALPHE